MDISGIDGMRAEVARCSVFSIAGETTTGAEVIFGGVETIEPS
jgi:hypothetical protein